MMGDLFIARNVPPAELDDMTFTRMSYWHRWHKIANDHEEEQNRINKIRRGYHPDA